MTTEQAVNEIFKNHKIDLKNPKFDIIIVIEMMYDLAKILYSESLPKEGAEGDEFVFTETDLKEVLTKAVIAGQNNIDQNGNYIGIGVEASVDYVFQLIKG